MDKLICEVCKKNEAVGVASSPCGPISLAYCHDCLKMGADALWVLASTIEMGLWGLDPWFWTMMTFTDGKYQTIAQVYGRQATMDMV